MPDSVAIWALTPRAAVLARDLADKLPLVGCYFSSKIALDWGGIETFDRLKPVVAKRFTQYSGHIFIMAAGIVVRTISPLLVHKSRDPAVVVMDEAGRFAISLVSGHLGGANQLAETVARLTGGQAVITTATDVNQFTAVDLLAKEKGLKIEKFDAIKGVNMALLKGEKIAVYDPYGRIEARSWPPSTRIIPKDAAGDQMAAELNRADAGVCIDDKKHPDLDDSVLILRPPTLTIGMGCNRNTAVEEMLSLLWKVFGRFGLALNSVSTIASVDLKADEPGLLELARRFDLEPIFFTREQLKQVEQVPTPSDVVNRHIGVKSVCEAAAILGAPKGRLIVCKQKSSNVTLAIARRAFTS